MFAIRGRSSHGDRNCFGGLRVWMDVFRELQGNEIWETHGVWIENEKPVFGPDIAARFSWAASLAEEDHSVAQCKQKEISNHLRLLLGEDNCLVIPTVPGPAPLHGGICANWR